MYKVIQPHQQSEKGVLFKQNQAACTHKRLAKKKKYQLGRGLYKRDLVHVASRIETT